MATNQIWMFRGTQCTTMYNPIYTGYFDVGSDADFGRNQGA